MFKDYYLILGIGRDATLEEIEKAFKDTDAKFNGNVSSIELQEAKEAFTVLSHQETKVLYDKELDAYNQSDDFANYEIKDERLANIISSLQTKHGEKRQYFNWLWFKDWKRLYVGYNHCNPYDASNVHWCYYETKRP